MDRLDRLRIFIRVTEMGSFTRAAELLALPRSTVSEAVRQLEDEFGTRLLHRTTRQVHATADGRVLVDRGRALLVDMETLSGLFRSEAAAVAGTLRVDVPSRIARRLIAPALPTFLRRYPRLQLVLGSTDRAIDPVREGVDCVIRVGEVSTSDLVARPVGCILLVNCASPAYLAAHGVPSSVDALAGHQAIGYASPATGRPLPWESTAADGQAHTVPLEHRVIVNNAESYIACCRAGLGLIQIPRYDVADLLASGELVEVLADWRAAPMAVTILYPHRSQRSRRLLAFVEWFEKLMAPHLLA